MKSIAPIVDELREIARDELPSPRTCKITLWDDQDYDIHIYHNRGQDEGEQIVYESDTGAVFWRYWKGRSWESEFVSEEDGTVHVPVFQESEERQITTIPPFSAERE